jgi:hypothetical protein
VGVAVADTPGGGAGLPRVKLDAPPPESVLPDAASVHEQHLPLTDTGAT